MILVLTIAVGLLTGVGVYLVLCRRMFPSILGFTLLAHAANLLMVAGGGLGAAAPIVVPGADRAALADPLPQAFTLTAIVISMAVTLYLLAVYVRSEHAFGSDQIVSPPANDDGRSDADVAAELAGRSEVAP